MRTSELIFEIDTGGQCPCYAPGDTLVLTGNGILLETDQEKSFITTAVVKLPPDKKTCRILISDLSRLLIHHQSVDRIPRLPIQCSGCSGVVTVNPRKVKPVISPGALRENSQNIDLIAGILNNFAIFQSLDRYRIRDIISYLKLKKFPEGVVILKKGDPAQHLYIIVSGAVEVLNEEGVCLSRLGDGDIFGEMSLISGQPVGATVKVVEPSTILFIRGRDFQQLLNKFPSIQMYLAKLLAQRLAKSNLVVAEEIASGMTGSLSEMPPSELFQTLNLNQKSGKLSLTLKDGRGDFSFRQGELVGAEYDGRQGKEAFFEILKAKEGRFKFQPLPPSEQESLPIIGPFLEMLLEGLKRLDETAFSPEEPGLELT